MTAIQKVSAMVVLGFVFFAPSATASTMDAAEFGAGVQGQVSGSGGVGN